MSSENEETTIEEIRRAAVELVTTAKYILALIDGIDAKRVYHTRSHLAKRPDSQSDRHKETKEEIDGFFHHAAAAVKSLLPKNIKKWDSRSRRVMNAIRRLRND